MTIDWPGKRHLPELKILWQQCFGDSEAEIEDFFRTGFSLNRCRCVTVEGNVAAALYWLEAQCRGYRLAYLYAIGTAPAFRGRGLCRALMEDTHRCLMEAGYAGAVLVPADRGLFSLYEKLGYRPFGGIQEFSCGPSAESIPLRQIGTAEYAALRRAFLPSDAVIQEGPTLAYLETMAAFYAGEDFLLTATMEGDTLISQEFLGEEAAASGILTALGAARGQFRVPGQTPFAMYRGLDTWKEPPSYFGLALD